jgi:hypothetical protein
MERKCSRRPGLGPPTLYTFLLGIIFITLSSSRILLVKYSANEGELKWKCVWGAFNHLPGVLMNKLYVMPFKVLCFVSMIKCIENLNFNLVCSLATFF